MEQIDTTIISQSVFTLFDAVSLIASIASLILAIVAIWLTLSFKTDSDNVNRKTSELLVEIKSESKSITQGVMSELKAYGEAMRGNFGANSSSDMMATVDSSDFMYMSNTDQKKHN